MSVDEELLELFMRLSLITLGGLRGKTAETNETMYDAISVCTSKCDDNIYAREYLQ